MARTAAGLPAGTRLTDDISLGVLTAQCPIEDVQEALLGTGRVSERERDLPAHVMVYYAMALALYADASTREVLRCLLEGARRRVCACPRWSASPMVRTGANCAGTATAGAPTAPRSRSA